MTIKTLKYHELVPNTDNYQEIFSQLKFNIEYGFHLYEIQPRLYHAFEQFLHPWTSLSWLLVKAPENIEYLKIFADNLRFLQPKNTTLYGGEYYIAGNNITFQNDILNPTSDFTVSSNIITVDWVENEQLFGCLRQLNGVFSLYPGLVHQANGGILIISMKTLQTQPLLWLRLKKIVIKQIFDWISFDEKNPLPINIPPMPLSFKVILIGNQKSLANFQEIEPELMKQAIYSEFEDNFQIHDSKDMSRWCKWVINIANYKKLPIPTIDAWPILIQEAVRYTGDQKMLPLCPIWLTKQLQEVTSISGLQYCNAKQLEKMFNQRRWREGFLSEIIKNETLLGQFNIETKGERIGQINALSIIEVPGHPQIFSEPSRISCVVHVGDGEFIDIESKVELGGNLHAKGIMIIRAFLMSQLQLEQQIPFSISLAFEQSYTEIDGDSASMAELCVIISALAKIPIKQNIAITGSVDQFGNIQPVGNLNEKIESFFDICFHRGLTGKQGVIIPIANIQNLSLHQEILDAVKEQKFSIWAVENIKDTLFLLTNLSWNGKGKTTILKIIQNRITHVIKTNTKRRYHRPWMWNWLRYFSKNN